LRHRADGLIDRSFDGYRVTGVFSLPLRNRLSNRSAGAAPTGECGLGFPPVTLRTQSGLTFVRERTRRLPMASDIFLKLGDIKGESLAHQLDHQFIKLGTDFDRLSDSFIDLISDAVKLSDAPGAAHDSFIKHDLHTIGRDFIKLGDDFQKVDDALHKVDDQILAFADQFYKFTPIGIGTDQGSLTLGQDFIKLDTDLKLAGLDTITLGLDFLKLDDTPNQTFETLAGHFQKLDDSLSSVGGDFIAIGADFQKLGTLTLEDIKLGDYKFDSADLLKIDQAFTDLGIDTIKIGNDFQKVSDDFLRISQHIQKASGGDQPSESLSLNFSKIAVTYQQDFQQLEADTIKLDADFKYLGNDTIKLSDALHDALHGGGHPAPVLTDSLEQVLALAHHFSLL
jgi:hypothetical protein